MPTLLFQVSTPTSSNFLERKQKTFHIPHILVFGEEGPGPWDTAPSLWHPRALIFLLVLFYKSNSGTTVEPCLCLDPTLGPRRPPQLKG